MKRTRQERIRLGLVFVLVCLFFAAAVARLVQMQIFLAPEYSSIVDKQSSGKVSIPANRGYIFDRFGTVVASNVQVSSLYAYPDRVSELNKVCAYLEKLFDLKQGSARRRYGLAVKKFRWIKRMLPDEMADRIQATAPPGLFLRDEKRREYPFGTVGRQILGFTDIDNRGQAGFELSYDSVLAGQQGWADIRRDGLRNTFRVNEKALVKPVPGKSFVLTVDWRLQEIAEEELQAAVEKHNASSGMAVFLDCNNGDILAAAHFDPSEKHRDKPVKLRPVTDQFEPGSVLKAFTAAGLLDNNLVNFSDSTFCEEGAWRIGRRVLHDDKEHGWLSFRQIMELSSNIGVAKHAIELGGETLWETMRRFGMGDRLAIGLPGETGGRLARPSRWSDYNIAALAMGHSVAVTAMQLAAGFAAIANGGELLRPALVLGEVDKNGAVVSTSRREVLGEVMSVTSADSLRAILRGVVERGTAEVVNSPAISIAGKTGTAQIPDVANKRYFQNKFVGSFAGFFPCEKPMIAGVVVLTEAHPVHYGGHTAGPAFRRIAERYAILQPGLLTDPARMLVENTEGKKEMVEVPDIVGRTVAAGREMVKERHLMLRCDTEQGQIVWQFPPADGLLFEGDELLATAARPGEEDRKMADLTGLSIREVSAFLRFVGIKFRVQGNGRVVRQSIRPGEIITAEAAVCRLECRPI